MTEIVKIVKKLFGLLLMLSIINACQEDEGSQEGNEIFNSKYFPLEQGQTNEYRLIKYTIIENGAAIDTSIYYQREEIVDQYTDLTGAEIRIIDLYEKADLNAQWQYQKSINSTITANQAHRTDGNFKLVKMILPIETNKAWDPTQYFDSEVDLLIGTENIKYYKNWSSKVLSQEESIELNGESIEDIITVQVTDHENRLELRRGIEKYASGIGLIYSEIEIFDTQCFENCSSIPWIEKADKGEKIIKEILNQD